MESEACFIYVQIIDSDLLMRTRWYTDIFDAKAMMVEMINEWDGWILDLICIPTYIV